MSTPVEYVSFLVRLWREVNVSSKAPAPDWHSEVEVIQTGQRWTFNSIDELLQFLRQQAIDLDTSRDPGAE